MVQSMEDLDEKLLGSGTYENDAALADALEARRSLLEQLVAQEKRKLLEVESKLEQLEQTKAERGQKALEKTLESLVKLEQTASNASETLLKVRDESERVRPLADKIAPLLGEMNQLKKAKGYVELLHAVHMDLDESDDRKLLSQTMELCSKLKWYGRFIRKANEPELHIGDALRNRTTLAVQTLRRLQEKKIAKALKDLHWPVTAANPSLLLTPENVPVFSSVLSDMVQLQFAYQSSMDTLGLAPSTGEELKHELWAIKAIVKPIVQRFRFHFSGSRSTNRVDQPDWYHNFLFQAVKDHSEFLADRVQPLVEKHVAEWFPGSFVDVFAHFIRVLVKALHVLYESKWETISKLSGLVCNTVDESLSLDANLMEHFGYGSAAGMLELDERPETESDGDAVARMVWPKAIDYWSCDKTRFLRWMEADLEFARRKVAQELSKASAWRSLYETVGLKETELSGSSGTWARPECSDHLVSILTSVADRAFAIRSLESQLLFVRLVELPLLEDYCAALETQVQIVYKSQESLLSHTQLSRYLILLNGAEYPRVILSQWQQDPRYVQLSHFAEDFCGARKASDVDTFVDGKAAQELLKGASQVTVSLGRTLLNASRSMKKHFQGEKRFSGEEPAYTSRSVLSPAIHRLEGFVGTYVETLCQVLATAFTKACSSYVSAGNRGSFNVEEIEPLESPELEPATQALGEQLGELKTKLPPRLSMLAAERLAQLIVTFWEENVIDRSKFNYVGGQRLARDFERLCNCFSAFSRRPDNKFFRPIKERVKLLALPSLNLLSLSKAIRRLMLEWDGSRDSASGRQLYNMLEDGYGLAILQPQETLLLLASRTDLHSS